MSSQVPRKLWEHPDPKSSAMYQFMQSVNNKFGLHLQSFDDLYAFSIQRCTDFWGFLFDASNYIYEGDYRPSHGGGGVVDESQAISDVPRWFDGVRLNFAENMLYARASSSSSSLSTTERSTAGKEDDRVAVTEVREGGLPQDTHHVTYGELRRRAAVLANAMATRAGVGRGDRVVVVGANSVHTLLVFLATSWLGALFSSCSTDMGASGILQRTVQVNPRLLFMDDAAVYNGKTVDLRGKLGDVVQGLRAGCSAFRQAIAIPRFADAALDVAGVASGQAVVPWADFVDSTGLPTAPPPFVRIDFSDPFLICFSSGTTGTPKAIVHCVGGLLLGFFRETVLHEGMTPDAVALQYTTTGWIMYLSAVAPLLCGARACLYDGSPFQPDAAVLLRVAARERVTKMGLSPRWMQEMVRRGIAPRAVADLAALRVVTCTGMVLSVELQHWFYDTAFAPTVQLANISGGTDIAGTFGLGNPLQPLYAGGTQGPCLGVDVRIYDTTTDPESPGSDYLKGVEVPRGEPGELVAVQPFPNIPCFFWNDPGSGRVSIDPNDTEGRMVLHPERPAAPPGSRYHDAYFARFRGVWAHGDFCAVHAVTGSIDFLGRADGVLNPSGVRFGSAEIYAVVERCFADRIADSLCVGQRRPGRDTDESVLLFVLMQPGHVLDDQLKAELRAALAHDLSKRHVPRYIFPTPAIPTTINMKKVELPVKRIVSGERITPSGTLANPQSLDYFYQFAEIEKVVADMPTAKL